MSTDVNNTAETSAAVAIADGWDEHGTPIVTQKPEPPKKEEPAASAPPAKVAKPEDKAAEPGAAKQEQKPKAKPSAEERIAELVADRNTHKQHAEDLEKRIRDLEAKAAPAPKVETKAKEETPKRPNPFTWTGTQEEFDKAMDKYEEYRDSQVAARTRQEQAQTEAQKAMSEVMKQTIARHPDAEEKIKVAIAEIMSKAPMFVKSFINDSEVLGELSYALSDTATRDNLLEVAKSNPGKALRALRDMELDIQKALSTPEAKVEAKPEEKTPEVKPRAPKPPSEVGGRGAATEDAATAAARDSNFAAFGTEMSRRYFKAS